MNCKICGYPYSVKNDEELWCPFCTIKTLEHRIDHIKQTIEGYDFPKTHSELTRGTFEGVANLGAEMALIRHDLDLLKTKILILEKNLKRLFK